MSELALIPSSQTNMTLTVNHDEIMAQAAEWFGLDVANGDARPDTIDSYRFGLKHWLMWCRVTAVDPGQATKEHIKMFRKEMVDSNYAATTISSKLTAVRRFYESAVQRKFITVNPAAGVRAPKDRSASGDIVEHLSDDEANLVFKTIPNNGRLKTLRDRAIIALMTIEGLRRVEIHRANDEDIAYDGDRMRMLIHGKGKDRYKHPRQSDVAKIIEKYIELRGPVEVDADGKHPLFVHVIKSGRTKGRITRRGLTKMVSQYFLDAGITKVLPKESGIRRQRNCHALRHTCGTDIYKGTGDLKLVQETLGHASIEMAAKYSHVDKRAKSRVTEIIAIEIT